MEKKLCRVCKTEKPISDFYDDKRTKDGKVYCCRLCRNIQNQQSYQKFKESRLSQHKKWKHDHRDSRKAKDRERRRERENNFPPGRYEELLAIQGGVCATCGEKPKDERRLVCDHCHSTGLPRGLLCDKCNLALGHVFDNPKILLNLIKYLEKFT